MIWCIKTYIIAYVKTQKIRYTIHYVKPTAQLLFKIRFPKVDQHAGGKWLLGIDKQFVSHSILWGLRIHPSFNPTVLYTNRRWY